MIDHARPRVAGVGEDAGERASIEGIENQEHGDDRQRPADAAAGRFEQQHDHDRAHHPVDGQRIADAELQIMEDPGHIEARDRRCDCEQPVVDADAERLENTRLGRLRVVHLPHREDEEDEAQHERDMNAAVGRLGQKAKTGRVVVKAGEREEQSPDQPSGGRQQRAKPHLGIELLLELLDLGLIDLSRCHAGLLAELQPRQIAAGTAYSIYGEASDRAAARLTKCGDAAT